VNLPISRTCLRSSAKHNCTWNPICCTNRHGCRYTRRELCHSQDCHRHSSHRPNHARNIRHSHQRLYRLHFPQVPRGSARPSGWGNETKQAPRLQQREAWPLMFHCNSCIRHLELSIEHQRQEQKYQLGCCTARNWRWSRCYQPLRHSSQTRRMLGN